MAKDLTDAFFQDLDASLREMGTGDTVIPKRMKKLAAAFYGRAHAYDGALDAQDEALINSLSMVLPFSPGDRQALLESPTLSDRRELLQGLIEFALHGGENEERLQ